MRGNRRGMVKRGVSIRFAVLSHYIVYINRRRVRRRYCIGKVIRRKR